MSLSVLDKPIFAITDFKIVDELCVLFHSEFMSDDCNILKDEVIIYHWRISHGPRKNPGYQEFSLTEYPVNRAVQCDVIRVFGTTIAADALDFAQCRGRRLDMLPENIMHLITRFLGYRDICRMSQTSKSLYQTLQSDSVWKPIFRTYFQHLATKEEIKLARHGGWRAWCKKIKISVNERQIDNRQQRSPSLSPTSVNRIRTIYPHIHKMHMTPRESLSSPGGNPNCQLNLKYPLLSPRGQRSGTIYPLSIKRGWTSSPTMQMARRHLYTGNAMCALRKKDSDATSSSEDNGPQEEKEVKNLLCSDLLETKSTPTVVHEDNYIKQKYPEDAKAMSRDCGMRYRFSIPKALHHPRTRLTPLPDIINEECSEKAAKVIPGFASPKKPSNRPTWTDHNEKFARIPGIASHKKPSNRPTCTDHNEKPKLRDKRKAVDVKQVTSEKKKESTSDKKNIKSVEDLAVEDLCASPSPAIQDNELIFCDDAPIQRNFSNDRLILDPEELLLVEGRYPAHLIGTKNLPSKRTSATVSDTKCLKPAESFGAIRKRLDESIGQNKEIDDFFENYMQNLLPNRSIKKTAPNKSQSKITFNSKISEEKKQIKDTINPKFEKNVSRDPSQLKSILKKVSPVQKARSEFEHNNKKNTDKTNEGNEDSNNQDAIYAVAIANDNDVQLAKKTSSQKFDIRKQNIQIKSLSTSSSPKQRLLRGSKSLSEIYKNSQMNEKYLKQAKLENVANEAIARYPPESKMGSLYNLDETLKKKQAALCVKSSVNNNRPKLSTNKTSFVADKSTKARD